MLEQPNLADSLATTQDLHRGRHNTSSLITLIRKGTELFPQIYLSKLSRWHSITVAKSLSYLK